MSLPTTAGGYRAILADPAWQFETWSAKGRDRCPDAPMTRNEQRQNNPARHYQTMPLADIKALPVKDVAAKDCVLFLWAVDSMLPQALDVGAAWGFKFKTVAFYWVKTRNEGSTRANLHTEPAHQLFPMGTGYWTRANPEPCLLFTRGKPSRISAAVRKLMVSPRREHSRKPDETRQRIQELVSGPYLEMFARSPADGWDSWGNETDKFADIAA